MMRYESMGAIEEAITIFRVRHPDIPLFIKEDKNGGFEININDTETGFRSIIYIPPHIYRDYEKFDIFSAKMIELLEDARNEMSDILEGKT